DLVDALEEALETAALLGAGRDDGRPGDEGERLPRLILRALEILAREQVALVEDDDEPAAAVEREARDLRVLLADALEGVDHQDDELAALHRADRLVDAERLHGDLLHRALPTHARRVDEDEPVAVPLDEGVDAVDRGAGAVVYELPLLAHGPVDHRRLARVGAAYDGDARHVEIRLRDGLRRRQRVGDGLFERAHAAAVERRDGEDVVDAELVVGQRLEL